MSAPIVRYRRPMRALWAVAFIVSGCSLLGFGTGREEAVRRAWQEAHGDVTAVVSAESGPYADFVDAESSPVVDSSHDVWAVVFSGTFPPASCGPARLDGEEGVACPAPNTSMLVILDYDTGDFIMAAAPAEIAH